MAKAVYWDVPCDEYFEMQRQHHPSSALGVLNIGIVNDDIRWIGIPGNSQVLFLSEARTKVEWSRTHYVSIT